MTCPHTPDVSTYLDGELSPGATEELRVHLETCRLCQQEFESLRSLSALFAEIRQERAEVGGANTCRRLWLSLAAVVVVGLASLIGLSSDLAQDELSFEAYLEWTLDRDVLEVSSLSERDYSRDRVVGMLISRVH